MTQKLYDIKGYDSNKDKWVFLESTYFNPNDSNRKKDKEIEKLKQKYGKQYYFNISNFFDVYT